MTVIVAKVYRLDNYTSSNGENADATKMLTRLSSLIRNVQPYAKLCVRKLICFKKNRLEANLKWTQSGSKPSMIFLLSEIIEVGHFGNSCSMWALTTNSLQNKKLLVQLGCARYRFRKKYKIWKPINTFPEVAKSFFPKICHFELIFFLFHNLKFPITF